jgi:hypothetical protein
MQYTLKMWLSSSLKKCWMWIATSGSRVPGTSNRFFSRSPSLSIAMAAPDHAHASRTESGRHPYGSTTSLLPVCTERDLVSTRVPASRGSIGRARTCCVGRRGRSTGHGSDESGILPSVFYLQIVELSYNVEQAMDPTSLASSHRSSTCRL